MTHVTISVFNVDFLNEHQSNIRMQKVDQI